jgi:hypothetical protein
MMVYKKKNYSCKDESESVKICYESITQIVDLMMEGKGKSE